MKASANSSHDRSSSQNAPGLDSNSRPGENGRVRSEDSSQGIEGDASSESANGLIQIVFRFVEQIFGSAEALIEVYGDRMRLSVRRTIVRAALGAAVGICAAIWLGAATLATVRGLCGGFTALWGGREWLGDLTGGLLGLAAAASAVTLFLHLSSRRELARLKAKYERIRNAHSQKHDTVSRADNG